MNGKDLLKIHSITTCVAGQAIIEERASSMYCNSDVCLHSSTAGSFTVIIQTLTALCPSGLKCTLAFGSVDSTRPKATTFPFPDKSINLHLLFVLEFAVCKLKKEKNNEVANH